MNQERYTDRVEIGKEKGVTSYLVHDAQLGRDVELRVWLPSPTDEPNSADAFMRPALLRARLEHPAIPPVLDSGDWPSGGRYYTLQLARGATFSTLLKNPARRWPAPPLRIVAEACRVLAHTHDRGVVHNNLSADHLIVTPDGAVSIDGWDDAQPLATGGAAEADAGDPRADVLALGKLLGIALRRDNVPDAAPLRELVRQATADNPEARPKDAGVLLAGLEGHIALDVPAGPRKRRKPRRILAAVAIALAVCIFGLAAAAAIVLWPQTRDGVPWIGFYEYLRNRQPDSDLARWFESEHDPDTSSMKAYAADLRLADHAIDLRSFNRARAALEQTALADRHWEWGYLAHRTNLDVFTFDPDIGMVFSLAFSPDGKWLAVGGSNRRVQLYQWPSGEFAGDLDGHTGRLIHVEFTPDSRSLISASDDNRIIVWELETREVRATFTGHSSRIWSLEQLPQEIIASSSWDTNIRLWDINTGDEVGRLPAPPGVWAMAFAPDQRRLYAGAYDGAFLIYDYDKRWPLIVQNDPSNFLTHMEVRSDGEEIAAAYFDPLIRLLDTDGRTLHELHGHEDSIWDVDYSPDGSRIISAGRDGTARIWDAQTHEQLAVIDGHDSEVNSVALDPEGNWLLTASDDGTIKGWRAQPWLFGSTPHRSVQASEIPVDIMAPVVLASNGRWGAAGMRSGDLLVWVPRGPRVRHRVLPAMKEKVTALALESNQGLLAAGGEQGALVLWSSRSGQILERFNVQDAGVTALAFSPDGKTLFAGGYDQQVRYWDLDTGSPGVIGNHHDSITVIAISPDGQTIASGSLDETIRIWRDRKIHSVLRAHQAFISALAFSPTGRYLASGGVDHQIYLWDTTAQNKKPLALGAHNSLVTALTFSPDGRRLFSGGYDGTVRVWDMASQRELLVLEDLGGWIQDVVFLADRRALLAINSDGTRAVWRAFPWEARDYPGNASDSFASRLAAYKRQQQTPEHGSPTEPFPFANRD